MTWQKLKEHFRTGGHTEEINWINYEGDDKEILILSLNCIVCIIMEPILNRHNITLWWKGLIQP